MYLKKNLEDLNTAYNNKGLKFRQAGDLIFIDESQRFLFNTFSTLKFVLQKNFDLEFDNKNLWHFKPSGIAKLSDKRLKCNPSKEIEELKEDLYAYLERLTEVNLKKSMKDFFDKTPCFFEAPASMGYHHAYSGGLLEHSVQTADLALALEEIYEEDVNISEDLIISGALLHDVGKMNCYNFDGKNIGKTRMFSIQNHIINGVKIVSTNIASEKIDDILHIIASHHNIKEWGSPIQPQSNEAWIIHNIENLSSKVMG